MNFLLDTNVVSEWIKPIPNPGVMNWFANVDEDSVFLSVVTLAELRFGVEKLPKSTRRTQLDQWIQEDLAGRFEDRLLFVDPLTAHSWGLLMARTQREGKPMSTIDGFIAATAQRYELTLVTRNTRDFSVLGRAVLNPWSK